MNNTQEDQQGVEESLRNDTINATPDATDNSTEVAINDAPWYFSPDPKLRFHYQITTPHEPNCGVINVGTFPNSLFARHVCKLHNDWLQFKWNKKAKKQDKLLENLKSDFALFKKGFEVLQDGWFDLNYLGVKTFWKTNEDSKNAILAYIRGNKERVEQYLFLLWFKKHVDEFDRMISHVSDGAKAVDILNHFSDVTLFDTKVGSSPRDRNIWDARAWYMTKKELKDTLEDWFDCDAESVLLPEFDGDGKCEVLGLALMDSMYAAVDDWVERVKKMSIAEHIAACNPQKVARVFNAAAERYNEGVNGYVTEKNKVDGGTWEGLMEGNKPLNLAQDVDSITIPINKKPENKPTCMRCKSCKDGCEFYDRGFCRGVVYPTYPPKYKRCEFENNGNAGQEYFTDEEINGFKGETNEPNRPGTNWKVGTPMPAPVLDEYEIKELIKKYGERMNVEDEDGETHIFRRLELKNPVHNPKFLGLNPVYDVLALRCPEEEDEETWLFEMECKVVCPARSELVVINNDGLMIESKLDIAAEVKSTVENLVKLSGRQVGKSSVNADASRELAKTLLGEGAVKEADEKVKAFINEDASEQILVVKINDKDAIEYFAGLEEDYDLKGLKFAFRSEGQGNGGSYRYYDTSDTVEVYADTITFTVGNSTAHKLGMDGKFKDNYQKLFEVAMNNPQVNDLFGNVCGTALLKPVQPINGIAINNLAPGSVDAMLKQKTTAKYDNFEEWEKAHENHENPVYDAECKIDHTVSPEKDEQPYDRSGAHKPLTVTKNTIKDLPQTYYVENAVKDLVDHLHAGEKIRAVVCFRSRLMSYMPPTDNKTITIANFLGHTKSMANLYQQWRIPIGRQVEEYLSHDWWYDKKHKCWTYVCNIGCEKDPFEFMALTPVLWDNHTYLGKDKDYKEAPFKYTDG